jgi:hypothetical protein
MPALSLSDSDAGAHWQPEAEAGTWQGSNLIKPSHGASGPSARSCSTRSLEATHPPAGRAPVTGPRLPESEAGALNRDG